MPEKKLNSWEQSWAFTVDLLLPLSILAVALGFASKAVAYLVVGDLAGVLACRAGLLGYLAVGCTLWEGSSP